MEKAQLIKLLGAFVAVLMIISIFAVAFMYGSGPQDEVNTSVDQSLQPSTFAYTIDFETQVLQELSALKFSALTTSLNIQEIDSAISGIEGVRKVGSQFQATGSEQWVYLADITTKKGYSVEEIAKQISELEFFSGEVNTIKYVTVSTPTEEVTITNETLGLDKNYLFETGTVSTMANINTMPGDNISVTGSISLQNNAIVTLELYEYFNMSQMLREQVDLNLPEFDDNSFNIEELDDEIDADSLEMPILDGNIDEMVVDENSLE